MYARSNCSVSPAAADTAGCFKGIPVSFMEFEPAPVKLVRSKQRQLAKAMRKFVLQARQPVALATQPIRPERVPREKQLVALRQLSEKPWALASRPARVQLAVAAQQWDQRAPVFVSRDQQLSIPSRD